MGIRGRSEASITSCQPAPPNVAQERIKVFTFFIFFFLLLLYLFFLFSYFPFLTPYFYHVFITPPPLSTPFNPFIPLFVPLLIFFSTYPSSSFSSFILLSWLLLVGAVALTCVLDKCLQPRGNT
jgi:hypothetical protein